MGRCWAVASPKQTGLDTPVYRSYSVRGVAASELFWQGFSLVSIM